MVPRDNRRDLEVIKSAYDMGVTSGHYNIISRAIIASHWLALCDVTERVGRDWLGEVQ